MKNKKTVFVLWIYVFFLTLFSYANPTNVNLANSNVDRKKGIFVASVGIAGSGKKEIFRELHRILYNSNLFVEFEKDEWPEVIRNKDLYSRLTRVTAFRNMRMPNYRKADASRNNGEIALMDNCVDLLYPFFWLSSGVSLDFEIWEEDLKLMIECLDEIQNTESLVDCILKEGYKSKGNQANSVIGLKYFLKFMYVNDLKNLAKPDVIVMFDIEFHVWKKFIKKRNPNYDVNKNFSKTHDLSSAMNAAIVELVHKLNNENLKCEKIIGLEQGSQSPILIADPKDSDCIKKIVLEVEDISSSAMAEKLLIILLKEKILLTKDVNFTQVSIGTREEIFKLLENESIETIIEASLLDRILSVE